MILGLPAAAAGGLLSVAVVAFVLMNWFGATPNIFGLGDGPTQPIAFPHTVHAGVGEGQAGIRGGPPGDLYISLEVQQHDLFDRDGRNILYTLPLTFPEAALGGDIVIPTLEGDHKLKIPSGTQPGDVFLLKGKGVITIRGRQRGDQVVTVQVITPRDLTETQRQLLEELAKTFVSPSEESSEDKGIFSRIKDALGDN